MLISSIALQVIAITSWYVMLQGGDASLRSGSQIAIQNENSCIGCKPGLFFQFGADAVKELLA